VQQRCAEASCVNESCELVEGGALFGRQVTRWVGRTVGHRCAFERIAVFGLCPQGDEAPGRQPGQHVARDAAVA
jgi:hypothetical protein